MSAVVSVARRSLWLILVVAGAGSLFAWWRDRTDRDLAPAEWPPLPAPTSPSNGAATATTADATTSTDDLEESEPEPEPGSPASNGDDEANDHADNVAIGDASEVTDAPVTADEPPVADSPDDAPGEATSTSDTSSEVGSQPASLVNALVDAPEARSVDGDAGGWVLPDDDGTCPITHPIKANDNSGIFHVPDGRFYDRTKAERCYTTSDAATADGYRQAKH